MGPAKSRGLLDAAHHHIARELVALAGAGQLLLHIHSPPLQPPASTPEQRAPQLSPHPYPAAVQAQLIGAVVVVPSEQFGVVAGPPFHSVVTQPHKHKGALPDEAWEVVYTVDRHTYWHPATEILSWHQAALATFPTAPQPSPRQRQPEAVEHSSQVTQHASTVILQQRHLQRLRDAAGSKTRDYIANMWGGSLAMAEYKMQPYLRVLDMAALHYFRVPGGTA